MISLTAYHLTIQQEKIAQEGINKLRELAKDYQLFFNEDDFLFTFSSVSSISYLESIINFLEEELEFIGLNAEGRYVDYVIHKTKLIDGVEIIGNNSINPIWLLEKPMNVITHQKEKFDPQDVIKLVVGTLK